MQIIFLWICELQNIFSKNSLFLFDNVDGPEENSSKLLSTPFMEDPQHRLKWTAYLEFTHNNEVGDLTWDKVQIISFFLAYLSWKLKLVFLISIWIQLIFLINL